MIDKDLMEAILAAPDDDRPRLELADRLERRGDPRGEFIKTQCALAKLASNDPQREALRAIERRLLAAHEKTWLAGIQCSHGVRFRRGFLADHTLTAQGWIDGVRYEHVSFVTSIDEYLRIANRLLDVAVFEYVNLDSREGDSRADDELWDQLICHPILERWRTLDCVDRNIDNSKFGPLIESPRLRRLDTLKVQSPVGLAGLEVIAQAPNLRSLRYLYWWNESTAADDVACVLAKSPTLTLQLFGFGTPIGNRGLEALTGARVLSQVESFSLDVSQHASPAHVARLLTSIAGSMRTLTLGGSPFGVDECLAQLEREQAIHRLRELELEIPIGDAGLAHLLGAVGGELEVLGINVAQLTSKGFELLLSSRLPRTLNISLFEFPEDDETLSERFHERFMNF